MIVNKHAQRMNQKNLYMTRSENNYRLRGLINTDNRIMYSKY